MPARTRLRCTPTPPPPLSLPFVDRVTDRQAGRPAGGARPQMLRPTDGRRDTCGRNAVAVNTTVVLLRPARTNKRGAKDKKEEPPQRSEYIPPAVVRVEKGIGGSPGDGDYSCLLYDVYNKQIGL